MRTVVTGSMQETIALGRSIGATLKPGEVVALFGELGSGKTQFVRGICDAIGVRTPVTSPTFTLINEYPAPFGIVAHIDLYRITSPSELRDIGLESYFHERCLCLIEWADRASGLLPPVHHEVRFQHGATETERIISVGNDTEDPR